MQNSRFLKAGGRRRIFFGGSGTQCRCYVRPSLFAHCRQAGNFGAPSATPSRSKWNLNVLKIQFRGGLMNLLFCVRQRYNSLLVKATADQAKANAVATAVGVEVEPVVHLAVAVVVVAAATAVIAVVAAAGIPDPLTDIA